jgi:hypothetical protein
VATTYDFFISDTADGARNRVANALRGLGYELTATTSGGLLAQKGSTAMTVLFGALAGKGFHLSFEISFFTTEDAAVARLSRNMAIGALKGGALGASKTATAFGIAANAIGTALHNDGVLARTVEA